VLVSLVSRADAGEHYAVYLPSTYSSTRRWPLLVLMDPRGRALIPLERFRPIAERLGYIVASSYDTRSDGAENPNPRAVDAIIEDAERLLSLDARRVYLVGFSGTARAAWLMSESLAGTVAGIVGVGAGLPASADWLQSHVHGIDGRAPFVVFTAAGTFDPNYEEVRALGPALAGVLVAAAGVGFFAVGALAPDTTGKVLAGSAARNWSPLYRERDVRTPRKLDPAEVGLGGEGFTVREARDTRYHRLLVVEDGTSRYLRFDSSFQSGMYLKRPFATRFSYSDYLQLGLAYNPSAKKILVIGLGGAAVQKRLWRDFRDVEVTTVELDPAVVDVAYRWFHLPRDARLPVVVDDGRRFLQRTDERFDVIMVDAFYSDGVPFHMTTLEFAQLMRDRLTPGGVVATNVIGALTGGSSEITRALWKTYAAVFPTVELHPVYEGPGDRYAGDIRNIILVGTERAAPTPARLAESWEETRTARAPTAPDLRAAARGRWERDVVTGDVPLLTDGYAPTDALLIG
jgi:spermidine synthase